MQHYHDKLLLCRPALSQSHLTRVAAFACVSSQQGSQGGVGVLTLLDVTVTRLVTSNKHSDIKCKNVAPRPGRGVTMSCDVLPHNFFMYFAGRHD